MAFVKTCWVDTHHFNIILCVLLCNIMFHLINYPAFPTSAHSAEMSNFVALHAHLAICWALCWWVCPDTVFAWLPWCTTLVHQYFCFAFLDFSGCIYLVKLSRFCYCVKYCNLGPLHLYSFGPCQYTSTSYTVIIFTVVNSFIISSSMLLSFSPCINCSLSCLSTSW